MKINPILYDGRPADCSDRIPQETACYDLLDELGICFRRLDHDPANTIPDCEKIEAFLGTKICKNLVLCNRQKTEFYLLLMEGNKPFRTRDLSKQIGSSRLSFAPAEEMERYLGVSPGSATVLAMMNDSEHRVHLLLDKSIAETDRFGCHPCINTSSLNISMSDILEKFLPYLGIEPIIVDLPDIRLEKE